MNRKKDKKINKKKAKKDWSDLEIFLPPAGSKKVFPRKSRILTN